MSLVFTPRNTHNSGQPSPLCPGLLMHMLFPDRVTRSPPLSPTTIEPVLSIKV